MKKFYFFFLALILMNGAIAQWAPQNSGTTKSLYSVYFTDSNTGHAVGDSGTILITTNGGTLWSSQTSNTSNALFSVIFTDAITGYAAGDNGTILKTLDGGTTWIPQTTNTSWSIKSIDFPVEDTGYAVGYGFLDGSIVLKTTDGGSNWIIVHSDTTLRLISIDFSDSDTGYIGGYTGSVMHPQSIILKTTNGGMTWSTCFGPNGSLIIKSVYFRDAQTGYVGFNMEENNGSVEKTIDGGLNWTSCYYGFWSSSIYFPTADTGYIAGEMVPSGQIAISRTTDGGSNWNVTPIENLITMFNSIFFTDSNTGWVVGTNGTILKTTNGGVIGLNESSIPSKFLKLYPNPAKDKITIESIMTGDRSLSIINVNGQKVIERQIANQKEQIDIHDLPAGVYFVKLQNENTVEVRKIFKE